MRGNDQQTRVVPRWLPLNTFFVFFGVCLHRPRRHCVGRKCESTQQHGNLRAWLATARPSLRLSDQLVSPPVFMENPREETARDAERTPDSDDLLAGADPPEHARPPPRPR